MVKRKKDAENEFQSFEETRRKIFLAVNLLLWNGHLKYRNNPVGMLRDPDHNWFVEPFKDYCLGKITLKEANRQLNQIRTEIILQVSEGFHHDYLRIRHRKKTGRDFDSDLLALKSSDKVVAQEAAIQLVKSFKPAYSKNAEIKKLIAKAIDEGDEDFINAISDARQEDGIETKRDLGLLAFFVFNAYHWRDPELTEGDVIQLAAKQKFDFWSKDSLLKYLRREGIKIKSSSRNPKKPVVTQEEIEKINSKKDEFSKYLFENYDPKEIKKVVLKIKKAIFS